MKRRTTRKLAFCYTKTQYFAFSYLGIPFLIFCIGFVKPFISIPICVLLLAILIKGFSKHQSNDQKYEIELGTFAICVLLIMIWVYLSGIGGFAFQNTDFHIRNAIFRDLITHPWPVQYLAQPDNPTQTYYLVYYIGFWLPAAIIGKLSNWTCANIALYIWTVIGVILVLQLISFRIKMSLPKLLLLLIFFSGLDALGVVIAMISQPGMYNIIWPPIYSIEWWIYGYQYSSFSTQLFWVFNQSVPAWICMSILLTSKERKNLFLNWSLCCFFAPLPAIGMFPYVVLKIPEKAFTPEHFEISSLKVPFISFVRSCVEDLKSCVSVENVLGGGSVVFITFMYLSNNKQAHIEAFRNQTGINWIAIILFVFFEGGFLWWMLKEYYQHNLNWLILGVMLVLVPFIHIGEAQDFCMRGSIPTLFYLFFFTASSVSMPKSSLRSFILILFFIGSYTAVTEIYRSVYRTMNYYINPPSLSQKHEGEKIHIYSPTFTEKDHPYTLVADSFKSLENFNPNEISNFVAPLNQDSFFASIFK